MSRESQRSVKQLLNWPMRGMSPRGTVHTESHPKEAIDYSFKRWARLTSLVDDANVPISYN